MVTSERSHSASRHRLVRNRGHNTKIRGDQDEIFYAACRFHDCPQRESRFGGDCGGIRGSQRQDLPDGATVSLGKFQEDLRLRQSLPLRPKFGPRPCGANLEKRAGVYEEDI